ncbi:MAG: homocysteine S-methyltransferase family protein [Gemmatimonadota bacterium]|nr:homocysteine S-methyltransferase family protein [Gemmatimonadota bacterium]
MIPFAERLASGVLLGDGALGTMLFDRGLTPGQPPESVTLSNPTMLEEIARLYLEAGADVLTTNTFGGSPLNLALHGLEAEVAAVNRTAVHALRSVAAGRAYVAGSCGPCGRLLEPYGDTSQDAMAVSFRQQMETLIPAGVDCVIVETMTDLAEATLAIQAAKDVSPATPVLATMTFDPTPRGYFTIMGVSVAAAAAGLASAGADAVGSNCGNGIEHMVAIAREFRRHTQLPLVIQANAGLPRTEGVRTIYDETPAFMADHARELLAIGVALIGGCCGTTPNHIAALRSMIDADRR